MIKTLLKYEFIDLGCGIRPSHERIVGGEEVSPHSYPWLAAIVEREQPTKLICGATLFSSLHALTAGHCVRSNNGSNTLPSKIFVLLGAHNLSEPETAVQMEVEQITLFPLFHYSNISTSPIYDLAILKFKIQAPFNQNIRPICLHSLQFNYEIKNTREKLRQFADNYNQPSLPEKKIPEDKSRLSNSTESEKSDDKQNQVAKDRSKRETNYLPVNDEKTSEDKNVSTHIMKNIAPDDDRRPSIFGGLILRFRGLLTRFHEARARVHSYAESLAKHFKERAQAAALLSKAREEDLESLLSDRTTRRRRRRNGNDGKKDGKNGKGGKGGKKDDEDENEEDEDDEDGADDDNDALDPTSIAHIESVQRTKRSITYAKLPKDSHEFISKAIEEQKISNLDTEGWKLSQELAKSMFASESWPQNWPKVKSQGLQRRLRVRLFVAGWGTTDPEGDSDFVSQVPRHVQISEVNPNHCTAQYGPDVVNVLRSLCAVKPSE